jgi:molecular chaperone GrpE
MSGDTENSEPVEKTEETVEETPKKEVPPTEDYKAKYFYLLAEMDNMRKRFDREKEGLLKYGNEKILSSLVKVIDDLDRSLEHFGEDMSHGKVKEGLEMVRKHFLEILEKNGMKAVESLGQIFDPHFHEAVAHQAKEGAEEGEIIIEYQKGYLLNDRLLRPAKVVIAKNN